MDLLSSFLDFVLDLEADLEDLAYDLDCFLGASFLAGDFLELTDFDYFLEADLDSSFFFDLPDDLAEA